MMTNINNLSQNIKITSSLLVTNPVLFLSYLLSVNDIYHFINDFRRQCTKKGQTI